MKTDDLIDALAAGLQPARPARLNPLLLACAAAASVAAVAILLGIRPALAEILSSPTTWMKGLYTAGLAGAALWLSARAGRPGADTRVPLAALAAIVGLAMLWGAVELLAAPGDERLADWLGRTWTICGRNILLVSAAAAVPTFLSARRLAPTRPAFSGFALGVATGGIAATAYGLLHCPESTAAFVATWYTLGVAGAGLIGAVAGRFALRW
ncbi:DUF1109 domain-containing protein [Brevundimonas sp.]|uniref:DUF1109 domain-containing protein n=1 Tax=Brevundimonas sp. TaxID=1871086 RepID=UPI00120302DA|nr:DUF1109 domain-containing protein [Brevundimonas sp.]TAJ65803.1 MAG: DUF1109 family protein [Brevundimonas sp.]